MPSEPVVTEADRIVDRGLVQIAWQDKTRDQIADIAAAFARVRESEREECAKVAEGLRVYTTAASEALAQAATAIRARGAK